MRKFVMGVFALLAVPVGAAPYVAPPATTSFVRTYATSFNFDVVDTGNGPTSATSAFSTASADYGHLTAETRGIPSVGGTGRGAHAGAFAQSSASDTLYIDFGVANRALGPLQLSFDFSVAGTSPAFGPPAFPASVGWMNASASWDLNLPRNSMSGIDSIERYMSFYQNHKTSVRTNQQVSFRPITGDFNFTVDYDPRGHRVALVPFSYNMYCGGGNQQIVIAGTQLNCLNWSFLITGVHVLDADGALVPDVEISAASTFDYNGSGVPILPPSLVPEPSTWSMLVTGFMLTGGLVRSRRRRSTLPG